MYSIINEPLFLVPETLLYYLKIKLNNITNLGKKAIIIYYLVN